MMRSNEFNKPRKDNNSFLIWGTLILAGMTLLVEKVFESMGI